MVRSMKGIKSLRSSKGFTMIELVIVIAILGILAAFALPRFGTFTTSAKQASHDALVGTLNSAIGIAHAQWIANGSTGTVTLDGGISITMNSSGYPDVGTTYASATACGSLVSALMSGVSSSITSAYNSGTSTCTVNNTNWPSSITLTPTTAT